MTGLISRQKVGEYKGLEYEKHFLKNDFLWGKMLEKMDDQAARQEQVKGDRQLIWFFDSKPVADFMSDRFETERLPIKVIWLPWPGKPRK